MNWASSKIDTLYFNIGTREIQIPVPAMAAVYHIMPKRKKSIRSLFSVAIPFTVDAKHPTKQAFITKIFHRV